METRKQQLLAALQEGDEPEHLIIYYQPRAGACRCWDERHECALPIRCSIADLPEREFDSDYGGAEGEPLIAFSDNYVYFSHSYDGADSIKVLPRCPESVARSIPIIGDE